jgi:DeoR/GlpR family transcriptional regulator of sugar metabolism
VAPGHSPVGASAQRNPAAKARIARAAVELIPAEAIAFFFDTRSLSEHFRVNPDRRRTAHGSHTVPEIGHQCFSRVGP